MAALVKQKQQRDWVKYNASLVNRGYLTIFVSKDFAKDWYVNYSMATKRARGGQPKYTEKAITALLSLRFVFHQPLRAMEGFAKSLVAMMNLVLDVPDYSTLSVKIKEMNIRLPLLTKDRNGHIISLDSTGLKIHGQGEWNRKKHKQTDRMEWVKMHVAVDNTPVKIDKVLGDSAYDTFDVYKKCDDQNIELVTPPKKNSVVSQSIEAHVNTRNKHVAYYQENGIYAWANKNDYWERNRAETTISRFVTTFSDRLASRNVTSQKNEITLKCHILNTFMNINHDFQDSAA